MDKEQEFSVETVNKQSPRTHHGVRSDEKSVSLPYNTKQTEGGVLQEATRAKAFSFCCWRMLEGVKHCWGKKKTDTFIVFMPKFCIIWRSNYFSISYTDNFNCCPHGLLLYSLECQKPTVMKWLT